MGRRSHTQRLDLWMNGLAVGYWEKSGGGERLVYFDDWIVDPQGRPLSLSLPFTPGNQPYRGALVSAFFDNLLPDSEPIRRRMAQRYKTGGTAPFDLLAALGRDCVGAIQMLPPGETPTHLYRIEGDALTGEDIGRLLRDTTATAPLGQRDHAGDLRLSIAGAQEKTALLHHKGRWVLPSGSTPTTHILKLPLGLVGNMQADMRTSVENEWLCAKIVAAFGLPIAACEIAQFGDQKALVVERFDRRLSNDGTWIVRLPQEDMCQATGTPPIAKYQVDGGPGIDAVMHILAGSDDAAGDSTRFFMTQLIFWLLAATDGHAKNFSIVHLPGSRYRATPLYDVLSAHPIIGRGANRIPMQKAKLAMAVRGTSNHYLISQIIRRHWIAQGQQTGLPPDAVNALIASVTQATKHVIDTVAAQLPADFPQDLAAAIFDGMVKQSKKLAAA
ncbi:type II toxin-antitoxin system HipA family toxin [Paraburkholderia sp. C35]|uniref:type II toxin-antitoxin system HipA family toxin n=1 Tax=Paraburkholderia sp. C35 TaxID=2126993 RepID=UPI000D68DFE9|nr:type II toxin-antitoxin system HipA family toxin [Paraburkholderia sp. C35]